MSPYRKLISRLVAGIIFLSFSFSVNNVLAQDGEALFKANCANCHKPDKDFTGPALKGWSTRVPSPDWVYQWVANPGKMVASDPYAKGLQAKWTIVMTAFPQLTKPEIDAILKYVDDYKPPVAAAAAGASAPSKPNPWLYVILTAVLAVVAFVLYQINHSLRHVADYKQNIRRSAPFPFYRRKSFIAVCVLLLAGIIGYYMFNGAVNLGRQQNYQPTQPIFYSHQVHAGVNQVSCLYCHGGAQDSKQAGIPSVNVCMNCHKSIKEYTGEPIVREDGMKVDGTAEIQKLYAYAGWDPVAKAYHPDTNGDGVPDGASPIQWVKIHYLPDHVYFNHSQHVKVGQQACQTCHGNIQEMPEVKQFSDLSMGWCINCHRTTKVNFFNGADSTGNKFYSIYEKFHQDMKAGKMDSVTVEKIGGTECQKCHY